MSTRTIPAGRRRCNGLARRDVSRDASLGPRAEPSVVVPAPWPVPSRAAATLRGAS
ncbi:MAG: hypothetical protein H6825_12940 [Planctomycetes bacterium]|nr:hypothetical protein [Planctomycetota bacterium]